MYMNKCSHTTHLILLQIQNKCQIWTKDKLTLVKNCNTYFGSEGVVFSDVFALLFILLNFHVLIWTERPWLHFGSIYVVLAHLFPDKNIQGSSIDSIKCNMVERAHPFTESDANFHMPLINPSGAYSHTSSSNCIVDVICIYIIERKYSLGF